MRKYLFIFITLVLSISIYSCKKNEEKDPAPTPEPLPTNQLYINFTLDGVEKSITGTGVSMHSGYSNGSSSSSGFFSLKDNISINLHMPLDSIMGSDLQSLIGQKILIASCGGCPTNINLQYEIKGRNYESYESYNPFPMYYIKFNSVTFYKNITIFDKKYNQYYTTGEFNLKLVYGTETKNATNGTFGLIFREAKQ